MKTGPSRHFKLQTQQWVPWPGAWLGALAFSLLTLACGLWMGLFPTPVMKLLFNLSGVDTLEKSNSMARSFKYYVQLTGAALMAISVFKTALLYIWYKKRQRWGLVLYVLFNLGLGVGIQFLGIHYYPFFYNLLAFPVVGIFLHILTLRTVGPD
ncbi:MAG: hypothetical protein N2050_08365 [Flavobacteriales bacterium]|nr:hypothetical protein [Flavobacteriales bacterium]